MKRLALLGATCIALAIAAAACGDTPVQPRELAGSKLAPSFATSSTSLVCENAVYPVSLCYPFDRDGVTPMRPKLCAALNYGTPKDSPFTHPVSGKPATEAFSVVGSDSKEVVTIPRPYGYPPQVLTFYITRSQIKQICA